MRPDLGKILTEPGKSGRDHTYGTGNRRENIPLEDRPSRDGKGRKHHGGKHKYGAWNAKVLNRIFKANVGRKWDVVNSEIRSSINSNNHQQMDQYQWGLTRYLHTNIKEIRKLNGQNVPVDSKEDAIYDDFWVHPTTGLLMAPIKRRTPKNPLDRLGPKPPKYIEINGKFYRVCFPRYKNGQDIGDDETMPEGHWFEIELVMLEGHNEGTPYRPMFVFDGSNPFPVWDAVFCETLREPEEAKKAHGRYAYAKSKRQLSGEEIKKLGLTNKFAGVRPRKQEP